MDEDIYVSSDMYQLYYCSYGKDGLHGVETLIKNNGIEYLAIHR